MQKGEVFFSNPVLILSAKMQYHKNDRTNDHSSPDFLWTSCGLPVDIVWKICTEVPFQFLNRSF